MINGPRTLPFLLGSSAARQGRRWAQFTHGKGRTLLNNKRHGRGEGEEAGEAIGALAVLIAAPILPLTLTMFSIQVSEKLLKMRCVSLAMTIAVVLAVELFGCRNWLVKNREVK